MFYFHQNNAHACLFYILPPRIWVTLWPDPVRVFLLGKERAWEQDWPISGITKITNMCLHSRKVNLKFALWIVSTRRITENVLELTEISLDTNLSGNSLKVHFPGSVLLPGVSVFETHSSVCVLIATTNSVHRLTLPHPDRLYRHVCITNIIQEWAILKHC